MSLQYAHVQHLFAIWGLDLAMLAGRGALGYKAHPPLAHTLLHLLLDHLQQ